MPLGAVGSRWRSGPLGLTADYPRSTIEGTNHDHHQPDYLPDARRAAWGGKRIADDESVSYERTLGEVPIESGGCTRRQLAVWLNRYDKVDFNGEAVTIEPGADLVMVGDNQLTAASARLLAALLVVAANMLEAEQ